MHAVQSLGATIQALALNSGTPELAALVAASPKPHTKQQLGERLYPLVLATEPQRAGKITGMLLDAGDKGELNLLNLLESPEALNAKIMEAISVLQMHAGDAKEGDN